MTKPRDNAVHFPADRRLVVRGKAAVVWLLVTLVVVPVALAWLQYGVRGLPVVLELPVVDAIDAATVFPAWLRITHYANALFLVLLARSGLSTLMDHPRLYLNDHCTPGSAWLRFTPVDVPTNRLWTAKDDARYISAWLALPGYRHTVGVARHWHLLGALGWVLNGVVFMVLLVATSGWQRLVPGSWHVLPDAWSVFVHYATLHLPPEPDPVQGYNALQQLAYFGVVFVMAPLSLLTGLAMSPSIDNRFSWYPQLFGGRQRARSLHFVLLTGYLAFLVMHVAMVFITGPTRNLNYITRGHDDGRPLGLVIAALGVGSIVIACLVAHWVSWQHPRWLQRVVREVHGVMRWLAFKRWQPRTAIFTRDDLSPFFWPNGKLPVSDEWATLAAGSFADYRLSVGGLVENPVELTLGELQALGKQEQITMHHCIQGWSGIAQWAGLPLKRLIELVRPHADAKVLVFYSFGEGLYGGPYYDTQPLEIARQAGSLLAYEMNDRPLPEVYGAPLRLRVESQLGYKMVKWIKRIEFVTSEKTVGKGFGGRNEDDEYFDLTPEI